MKIASEWSDPCVTRSKPVVINKPSITSPKDGSVGTPFTLSIGGSLYKSNYPGSEGTHYSSDWVISRDVEGMDVVQELLGGVGHRRTMWVVTTTLPANTPLYVKVRYRSVSGHVSEWSEVVGFTTSDINISVPTILTPEHKTQITTGVEFVSSEWMVDQVGVVDYLDSEWQMSTDREFYNLRYDDYEVEGNSWSPSGELPEGVVYVRVRHRGTGGRYSEWSEKKMYIVA